MGLLGKRQVLVWDRGRPARNANGRCKQWELRLMYVEAGGTPAVPDKHLIGTLQLDQK